MGADYLETAGNRNGQTGIGIGEGSKISKAIIDKNARIGRNVVLKGSRKLKDCDGDGYAIRDGLIVVLKNAVIPDGTRVG